MGAASWSEVERILGAALELEPGERDAFLASACGDDDALRREVESLLAADARSGSFLEPTEVTGSRAADRGEGAPPPGTLPLPGDRVGSYRIVRELGRGGASVVFLGQRDDGRFDKQVAIKVLTLERPGRDSRERFRNECSILAAFEHPDIARLYDAGHLDNGAPYVVMELVEGEHLDSYCDRRGLSVEERIRLLCRVCRVVHYAHRHLVVHRDIKPGNILVTADGSLKLLDFGIAKLLVPETPSEPREPTAPWLRPMTPTYASPEQILGEPTTTASDVYSLGVLLFRLLTGRLPHDLEAPTLAELNRYLDAAEVPKKPSEAVTEEPRAPAESQAGPAGRGPSRGRLRRRLAGDLDSIVLKAMRREPERRYGSAAQLADDLERHLAGEPVQARAGRRLYYWSKLLRRHRIALAAVAAFIALSIGFSVTTSRQSERVRLERDKLQRTSTFFYDLFLHSNPDRAADRELPAREILDRGASLAAEELGDSPLAYAAMIDVLGSLYAALGLFDEAEPLLEEGLEIRRRLLGPRHREVASSLFHLAEVHHGRGRYREAADLHRRALGLRRRVLPADDSSIADSLDALGVVLSDLGVYEEAETHLAEALELRRERFGTHHRKVGQSLTHLGHLRTRSGALEAAQELLAEALAVQRDLLPGDHPDLAITLQELGLVARDQGRPAAAEELFREALEVLQEVHGDHHARIANLLNELAMTVEEQGRLGEAEPLFRQALELFRRSFGDRHPDTLTVTGNLAHLLMQQRNFDAAEALYREVWRIRLEVLGGDHPLISQVCYSLAVLLHRRGELDEAEVLYRKAGEMTERLLPPTHPARAFGRIGVGEILIARGEGVAAEPLARGAVTILEELLPADHRHLAHARSVLGGSLVAQGRFAEAEPWLASSHPRLLGALGEEDPRTVRAAGWLAAARRARPDDPR